MADMVGLPNHHVIPPLWQQHHRPIAESSMTGVGELRGPDGPPPYGSTEPTPGPLLAEQVPCRIQQTRGEYRQEAVGQLVDTRQYLITTPLDKIPPLQVTDRGPVFILTGYAPGHDGDPHLVGRHLRVTNVQHGTLVWERDLTAVDDLTNGGQ